MKCAVSDKMGLDEVDRTKEPYIYTCHMGLTEVIVPILQDGEIAGYLMMGQISEREKISEIIRIVENLKESREVKKNLVSKLEENTTLSRDKIEYCVNILKVLIEYMNLSYVFKKNNETLFSQAKKYIMKNMSNPVSAKNMCKQLGVSQSTLYKEIKKNTDLSPTEFIRRMKTEKAKGLLLNTRADVAEIAEKVGIPDTNYFIRLFKKETGCSPLQYRKMYRQQ
jgi:AraC-like DNA-binding protein